MSTKPHDDAFPVPPPVYSTEHGMQYPSGGLTKREYFAAHFMQAIITADDYQNVFFVRDENNNNPAKAAVRMADELIEELNKARGES